MSMLCQKDTLSTRTRESRRLAILAISRGEEYVRENAAVSHPQIAAMVSETRGRIAALAAMVEAIDGDRVQLRIMAGT